MKKSNVIFLCVMLVLLTITLTFTVTMFFIAQYFPIRLPIAHKVAAIESRLQNYYIGEYDEKTVGDKAAEAIISAIGDRWSYYIPSEEYGAFQDRMDNAYSGIGITINDTGIEKGFPVATVQEGSPAERAGIQVGDVLTHIEDESALKIGFEEMQNRVRGEVGTWVRLTLERDGTPYTTNVRRMRIDTVAAKGTVLESGVGYVRIENFDRNAAQQTIDILADFKSSGVPGVIFDVRSNPGGHQAELVKLLDHLLPEGDVFRSIDYTGAESTDRSDAAFLDLPMVVLVDRHSYSAAEFFAAALQDYEKAKIVGEPTTGKGNYQVAMPLPDGSAINISIGKYFTPKGKSLTDTGLTPDVTIPVPENENADETYSKQLETAEKLILSEISSNNGS
ncbi:MAG: S41 family peptidase [Oscillospiraceae bacterium]|nr:S41 family peptidase [Oscillospiraceae bacterium]